MDWRAFVRERLPEITGDPARDADIVEELAQYLASRAQELQAGGVPAADAIARVSGELSGRVELASAIRAADRRRASAPPGPPISAPSRLFADLGRDVRYALRLLRRAPGFTAAVLVTLALGIGMTTAIYSVVQVVLIRPVPFPEPGRLVMMWETDRNSGTTREPASMPDFLDYRAQSRQVDRIGSLTSQDMNLTPDRGDPFRLSTLLVTNDLLEILGVDTIAGRSFRPEEDAEGGPGVALISDGLWDRLFQRSPSAIGATIRLDDAPRTIVGVVPPTADFGVLQILSAAAYARGFADRDPRTRVDVWLPLQPGPDQNPRGGNHGFIMVGRLAPGATVASAQEEMAGLAANFERTYPDADDGRGAFVESLDEVVLGRTRTALAVLMLAVSLVLLMACVNVANLLLARGTARAREVAVRTALGAEMRRLARQFAVENVVLAVGAAALGVPLAYALLRALVAIGPANIPRLGAVALDTRVLLVALAVSTALGLVFGLLPVAQARRVDVQTALKAEDARGATRGRDGRLLRSALVVSEIALAVVLVTGAGLLIRSFWNLSRTDPGFDVTGVLKAEFQVPFSVPVGPRSRPDDPGYDAFTGRVLDRVRQLPGVASAALAANQPLDAGFTQSFLVPGREAEAETWPELSLRHVTPDYFSTMHVPRVAGRLIESSDIATAPSVVLINEAIADRFFPGQNPVGQTLRFWGANHTIVGVVGNERIHGLANAAPIVAYAPLAQTRMPTLALLVRTGGDPAALASSVRGAIREIDPELAVFGVEPLATTLSGTLSEPRFLMLLLGLFGLLALALAGVGVHGVLAYLVAQRTKEIGVRVALGATGGQVTGLVVGQGLRLVAAGLVVGAALAFALGRSIRGLLFGVTPTDVPTLVAVVLVIAIVASIAMWLPARRATHVDPLQAIREN